MRKYFCLFLSITFVIISINVNAQKTPDHQIVGDSLYKAKDYKGAIERYNTAIEINREKKKKLAILYDKRAQVETDQKEIAKAIEDESFAISLNPNIAGFYWNRAIAYGEIGNQQLAINDYDRAIELNKKNSEKLSILYDNKGIEERHRKNYKQAIEDHNKALYYNSKNGDAYWNRGMARSLNGEYQLAIGDFSTAMFYNFDSEKLATLYGTRGNTKRLFKRNRDALTDLNTAISLDPKNGRFYSDRGLVYQSNGDYQLAIDDFNTAIPYFQESKIDLSILYSDLALNKMALRKLSNALDDATKAIGFNKESGYIYYIRGNIYSQMGKCRNAIEDFNKALYFYADDKNMQAIIRTNNASNFYVLKENQKVIDECGAAMALNPNLSSPYLIRGKVYFKRMGNKDLAMKDFIKALELDTSKSTSGYIFSQLYLGHADIAIERLQQLVLNTSSSDDVIVHYYNMACVFSFINKPKEANIYLRKVIESGYSKNFASNDEDFDNIRKTPDYIALMSENFAKQK